MSKLNPTSTRYRRLTLVALGATAFISLVWLGSEALRQSPREDLRAAQSAPPAAPGAVDPLKQEAPATVAAQTSQVDLVAPDPSGNTKRSVTRKAKAARRAPALPLLPAPTTRDTRLPDMEVSSLNGPAMIVPHR